MWSPIVVSSLLVIMSLASFVTANEQQPETCNSMCAANQTTVYMDCNACDCHEGKIGGCNYAACLDSPKCPETWDRSVYGECCCIRHYDDEGVYVISESTVCQKKPYEAEGR